MASIERTAYPRFKRFLSARELHVFYTPQPEEIAWAREQARSDSHQTSLVEFDAVAGVAGTVRRGPRAKT